MSVWSIIVQLNVSREECCEEVISYSRRGHYKSEAGPAGNAGTAAGDLYELAQALRLGKFHLVGTGAGAYPVVDFALEYPEMLLSAAPGCTLYGSPSPEFTATIDRILPHGWDRLPAQFREVSASYRGDPEGVAQWIEYAQRAITTPVDQGTIHEPRWDAIACVSTPLLVFAGDCDLYLPPSLLRVVAE